MPFRSLFEGLNCASSSSSGTRRTRRNKKKSVQNNGQPSAPGEESTAAEGSLRRASAETYNDEINNEQSFWEVGRFKIALKRCDNGSKLANDLSDLISERAKLEDNYGKALKNWSNKWTDHLNKDSSEYETTKDAWVSLF